jgi:hypothetical protein
LRRNVFRRRGGGDARLGAPPPRSSLVADQPEMSTFSIVTTM